MAIASVLLLLLLPALAPATSRYEWTKPALGSRSMCVVVDAATGGKKSQVIVEDAFCTKPETYFAWTKPEFGYDSRCEERDRQKDGEDFLHPADPGRCPRLETVHLWLKPLGYAELSCVEVDSTTKGKHFRRRAGSPRLCPMLIRMNDAFPKPEAYVPEEAGELEPGPAVNQEKQVKSKLGREFEANPAFWEDLLPAK